MKQDPRESFEGQKRVEMPAMNEKNASLPGSKEEISRGSGLDTDEFDIRAGAGWPVSQ